MAQDLMKISVESFGLMLYNIPTSQLKSLLKQIYELKWSKGKDFSIEQTCDLERKESLINSELMERKYLTQKEYTDYFGFLKSINKKKRVY